MKTRPNLAKIGPRAVGERVKLPQNMATQPPPLTSRIETYNILIHTGKGRGGGELDQREG